MKSSFRTRWGHERTTFQKKSMNRSSKKRRAVVLLALTSDLETGMLRQNGVRTDIPLTDKQISRITKEIEIIKTRL